MSHLTYRELGIPAAYIYDQFLYASGANLGVAVFTRDQEPRVNRIFWRGPGTNYTMVPVTDSDYSLDSCFPSRGSGSVYYIVMHRRKPEGHKSYGGYWVSLNKFCFDTQTETILVDKNSLDEMTGASGSWISRILNVSPDDSEIDLIAGVIQPSQSKPAEMRYDVYRVTLGTKKMAHRLTMPGVFI